MVLHNSFWDTRTHGYSIFSLLHSPYSHSTNLFSTFSPFPFLPFHSPRNEAEKIKTLKDLFFFRQTPTLSTRSRRAFVDSWVGRFGERPDVVFHLFTVRLVFIFLAALMLSSFFLHSFIHFLPSSSPASHFPSLIPIFFPSHPPILPSFSFLIPSLPFPVLLECRRERIKSPLIPKRSVYPPWGHFPLYLRTFPFPLTP